MEEIAIHQTKMTDLAALLFCRLRDSLARFSIIADFEIQRDALKRQGNRLNTKEWRVFCGV
jgi:hypothetical protein